MAIDSSSNPSITAFPLIIVSQLLSVLISTILVLVEDCPNSTVSIDILLYKLITIDLLSILLIGILLLLFSKYSIIVLLQRLLLGSIVSTILIYSISILLGGSIYINNSTININIICSSIHIALLGVIHCIILTNNSANNNIIQSLIRIYFKPSIIYNSLEYINSSILSVVLLFSWLSSYFIVLDHDSKYQLYPLLLILASNSGYCIGLLYGLIRMKFNLIQGNKKLFQLQ